MSPLKVLCLDIEGGYGGSSRSLFELVRWMDREAAQIEVWCKREGPIQERYHALGVPAHAAPAMPKRSALPRLSRNLWQRALTARDFLGGGKFRAQLKRAAAAADLVHLNHEGLFLLGRWLRGAVKTPMTAHVRTMPHESAFARWQARSLFAATCARVYISENEQALWHRYAGCARPNPTSDPVIYNAVESAHAEPHDKVPLDKRFRVACVANYAWVRGIDRLVDVAQALAGRGRRDFLFVVAGDMRLTGSLPGALGAVARRGGTLADYALRRNVAEYFLFLGHVPAPERVLASVHVLAKPTREYNPWGRDILEAMAAGLPVISIGGYGRFIEDRVTGFLLPEFDADRFADRLILLADDRAKLAALGAAARDRVRLLCDGPARASDLLALWRRAASGEATGGRILNKPANSRTLRS